MSAYQALCSIVVEHAFFANGRCRGLQFVASADTAALLQHYRILARPNDGGIDLLRECDDVEDSHTDNAAPISLRYMVFSNDPLFSFYTENASPAQPLYFNSGVDANSNTQLTASPWPGGAPWAQRQGYGRRQTVVNPCMVIDIEMSPAELFASTAGQPAAPRRCVIALQAASIYWKYYFFGDLATRNIEIRNLDAVATAVGFNASTMPVPRGGTAFVSQIALPMQEVPAQRFQLRDKDELGRVLIKRLPNAGINKIGKETIRDGQQVLVAEIYINQ